MTAIRPKFCMECGNPLTEGAKFCAECGTKVPVLEPAAAPPTPPDVVTAPDQPPTPTIPSELKAKFEAAQKELRGDRREVVVLFADLKGFTSMSEQLDPEEVSLIMQRLLGELADAVHRYEGYVDKYIGDAIMALFGAPLAHENDAERAILAALDMLRAVARRNEDADHRLSLRVGLNLGEVVAADMGSAGRVQYTVMGDTVNVASRLEGAAQPDTILISHAVQERIAHRFETEEVPPVTVKGKSEPLRVHRVLGMRTSQPTGPKQTTFVGRENELEILLAFLDRVAAGKGDVLLIEAEAGAGKSRLISEGIERSVAEEAVIEVAFTQIQLPGQLSAAVEIFRKVVAPDLEDVTGGQALLRAQSLVGDAAKEHRNGLSDLAHLAFGGLAEGGNPAVESDPRAARQNRWLALVALIGAASEHRPVVIVVEDVHWADEEGQEFLAFLHNTLASRSVGIILTALTGGRPEWLPASSEALRLEALGEEAARSILGGILESLRPSVRREIIRRSQGNPLYLEELARSLTDTLETTARAVPGNVQGILQTRIDRLDSPVRLALQMAAVLGPRFSVGLLHRMYALDPQPVAFETVLQSLEEKAFVEPTEREDVRSFRHALMQEVAYGGILLRLRKVLHESAARLGEEHYADRLESEAAFFAHHYWEAEIRERAAPHLFRAGMSAAAQYDLHAAERWFGRLSEVQAEHADVLSDPSDRAEFMIKYGAVLLDRGRYDASDEMFERLAGFGSDHAQDEWVGQALRYRGQIAALRGRLDDSRGLFEEGLQRMPAAVERLRADLHTGLGLVLYYSSDGDGALSQFEQALQLYERVEDRLGKAKCYINIGNVLDDLRSDGQGAEPSYVKALKLIEEVDDRRLKTGVLLNLGTLAIERGDWEDALERFRHVETVAEEIGWSFMRFLSLQNQASCNLFLGRIGDTIGLLETCLREGETTMRADDRIRSRQFLFQVYLASFDATRAAERLEEARRVATEIGFEEVEDGLRLDEGRLIAASGEWSRAGRSFSKALEAATDLGHPTIIPLAQAHLYRATILSGGDAERPSFEEVYQKPNQALLQYLVADADAGRESSDEVARALEGAGEIAGGLGYLTLERAAFQRAAEVWNTLGRGSAHDEALRRAARSMAAFEANLPPDLRAAFTDHPRNEALKDLAPA